MSQSNFLNTSAQQNEVFGYTPNDELLDCLILVVDDSQIIREVISAYLKAAGYRNIAVAENGIDALDFIASTLPEIIILDIEMPKMDGFEFCGIMNSDPKTRAIPILVQTGRDSREDVIKAFQLGATDMIRKPIKDFELLSRIRVHLENKVLLGKLTDYSTRVSQELEVARGLQQAICPSLESLQKIKNSAGLDISWHYEPSSELGGDIWGIQSLTERKIVFYIADFSGHGVASALNTFRLHSWLSELQSEFEDPASHMTRLNNFLCENLPAGVYATMLLGCIDLDTNELTYAAAGTPSPIYLQSEEGIDFTFCDSKGMPLGLRKDWQYENRILDFAQGSQLFLYSDALVEATDHEDVMLGENSLLRELQAAYNNNRAPKAILKDITDLFKSRNVATVADDLTIVLLSYEGVVK